MIRKAFREEIPDTTKIIIAQRISSVEDADLIIVMDDGKINGMGTSEELLKTNAIYQESISHRLREVKRMSKTNDKPKVSAGTIKTAGRLMKLRDRSL